MTTKSYHIKNLGSFLLFVPQDSSHNFQSQEYIFSLNFIFIGGHSLKKEKKPKTIVKKNIKRKSLILFLQAKVESFI